METLTLNIHNEHIKEEIIQFLQKFKSKDLEFTYINDLEDLKLLQQTRDEKTISFDEYLKNEN
jgi:hypothetical protein